MDPNEPLRKLPALTTSKNYKLSQVDYDFFKLKKKVLNNWTFLFLPGFLPHYGQCLQDNMKRKE